MSGVVVRFELGGGQAGEARASRLLGFDDLPHVAPEAWTVHPELRQTEAGYEAVVDVAEGTSLYGTGEVAGPLLRNGVVTEVWAQQPFRIEDDGTAVPNYDAASKSLYQAHPWVLGVREDGSAFGVLADTTYRVKIDLRRAVRLTSRAPFSVIVIDEPSPQDVLRRLAELAGRMPLPPHWALGYHQCRFSYYPDARVREVADELRHRKIPCDAVWIDIHYMDAYKVFTFDPERFPNPPATNAYLHKRGFRSVWILDPAIKAEPGYEVYEQGLEEGHFVRDPDGQPYLGSTWPGDAAFPDFTQPKTRRWWGDLTRRFLETEADGLWLDLNEPSLILPPGAELPENLRHMGGGDLPPGDHARYHNVYGMLMARATDAAMRVARPSQRPFILSRSNFLGGHRYAAAWTGDNVSSWTHLPWSVSMVLNLGLSGQPFSGPDIGGFAGTATEKLFAHWVGVGALLPFSRTHTGLKSIQDPWTFGPEVEEIVRTALARRYRLLPYLYTVFREAAETGLPVARPVFFADPADPSLREEDHAFLLGDDLLVVPALEEKAEHRFHLPAGSWRPIVLEARDTPLDAAIPELRIRDGAILPIGAGGQTTSEAFASDLTLVVSLDDSGLAAGRLYEDEGEGYGYLRGDFRLTTFRAHQHEGVVEVWADAIEGRSATAHEAVSVEVVTDKGRISGRGRLGKGRITLPL